MTDFDFAGFLDTDNQKNFAISLIKLFDSIILDQNAEQILHHVNEVQKNSICNDFGGLVSALSNFDLKNISSKLSLLSVINLITPNLSISDQLNDDWEKTFKISKDVILKKIDVLNSDTDLRYIAQISQWAEGDKSNAMIFQKLAGKHVLVTGGAGFIGSNLCEKLISLSVKVRCLDNYATGKRTI